MRQIGAGAYCGVAVLLIAGSFFFWMYEWYTAGHTKWVSASAWSADGKRLITAAGDDQETEVLVWDKVSGKKEARVQLTAGRPYWLQDFAVGNRLVLLTDGVRTDQEDYPPSLLIQFDHSLNLLEEPHSPIDYLRSAVPLERTGRLVIYGFHKLQLQQVDGQEKKLLFNDRQFFLSKASASENERFLAASSHGRVFLWDLETDEKYVTLLTDEPVELGPVAISDDGRHVAAVKDSSKMRDFAHKVFIWDRDKGETQTQQLEFSQPVSMVRIVEGEGEPRFLVVAGRKTLDCSIGLYSADGQLIHELYRGKNEIKSIDLHEGAKLVWVDDHFRGEMWSLDGETPERLWTATFDQSQDVTFSPDGQLLAGHGFIEDVYLYDSSNGKPVITLNGYHPSNQFVYAIGLIPIIIVVGALTWYEKQKKRQRQSGVTRVAELLNWEMTTGQLPASLPKFRFFSKRSGGHFEHILMGEGTSHAALLAVYAWTEQSGKNRVSRQELCIIFPNVAGDLPELMIQPETIIDRMAEWVGYQDIDLTGSDAQRDFSNAYVLRSVEPERMEDIIHDDLARFLCKQAGWNMEVKEGSVLMWWQRVESFTQPRFKADDSDKILAFRDEAETILELLLKV